MAATLVRRTARWAVSVAALVLGASAASANPSGGSSEGQGQQAQPDRTFTRESLCELVDSAAAEHGLPVDFFTRLIWQESSFRIFAVSPKGAQGIAQFMPSTASERGLADPFDPEQAIPASAHLLKDLDAEFGNLGLAAAAYNAGRRRVSVWRDGGGFLPWETRAYVASITGRPVDDWLAAEVEDGRASEGAPGETLECVAVLADLGRPSTQTLAGLAPRAPWGVQVAGHFSQARALASYDAVRRRHSGVIGDLDPMLIPSRGAGRGRAAVYGARVPAQTRAEAEDSLPPSQGRRRELRGPAELTATQRPAMPSAAPALAGAISARNRCRAISAASIHPSGVSD